MSPPSTQASWGFPLTGNPFSGLWRLRPCDEMTWLWQEALKASRGPLEFLMSLHRLQTIPVVEEGQGCQVTSHKWCFTYENFPPSGAMPCEHFLYWIDSQTTLCIRIICLTKWLKSQKLIASQYWKLEVQDEGVVRAGFSRGLSPWLIAACLFLVSCRLTSAYVLVLIPFPTRTPATVD